MRYLFFVIFLAIVTVGCTGVTSPEAERVTLYQDEGAIPGHCKKLGEVTASVCANTTPCPAEVMKKHIREKAFTEYGADVVWLYNTTLSGTEVVGYGIAYQCHQ